jgi:putative mRNA 3-end processing factor
MKFIFHGAAKEVGRSCIELITQKNRFLFDSGIKLKSIMESDTEENKQQEVEYPTWVNDLEKIDAVFLSHAHLDHSGALPMFNHFGLECPIFATTATAATADILLKDSYKIESLIKKMEYGKGNIKRIQDLIQFVNYKTRYTMPNSDVHYTYFDAGHIPGSSSVLLETEGKRILYSGDINFIDTNLMKQADINYGEVDILITESTYGDREHTDRKETENELIESINEGLKKGPVLLPTFAVGRAQELIIMLAGKIDAPIYVDGMASSITKMYLNYGNFVKDLAEFKNAISKVDFVQDSMQRRDLMKQRGVFITTAGMLDGGPIIDYLKTLWNNKDCSLFLTGYQAEHSNGRMLLNKGRLMLENREVEFRGKFKQFDLSAHTGLTGLKDFIKKVNPKKLIINHGDAPAEDNLKKYAESIGIETYEPELDDRIEIN